MDFRWIMLPSRGGSVIIRATFESKARNREIRMTCIAREWSQTHG